MPGETALKSKSNSKNALAERLGTALASSYALQLKTQNFHWNVTGPNFAQLHQLFEQQYDEIAAAVDVIAERIRALGAMSPGGLDAFAELSEIEDAPNVPPDATAMVKTLASDHEAMSGICRDISGIAEEAEDMATADLMNSRTTAHDKAAWMLRAHNGG